jgi:hypothetical protein
MRLSLYFRDDVEEARGDAVAYLWNETLGPTDGVRVTSGRTRIVEIRPERDPAPEF